MESNRVKDWAPRLSIAAWSCALWGAVWPQPLWLLLLLTLGFTGIALWLITKGRATAVIEDPRHPPVFLEVRPPSVTGLLYASPLIVGFHAAKGHLLTMGLACAMAAVTTVCLVAATWRHDPTLQRFRGQQALWVLCLFATNLGVIVTVNELFDTSAVGVTELTVVAKRETSGRAPTRTLILQARGAGSQNEEEVERSLYREVLVGDRVLRTEHRGNLGLRWYSIDRAPRRPLDW